MMEKRGVVEGVSVAEGVSEHCTPFLRSPRWCVRASNESRLQARPALKRSDLRRSYLDVTFRVVSKSHLPAENAGVDV